MLTWIDEILLVAFGVALPLLTRPVLEWRKRRPMYKAMYDDLERLASRLAGMPFLISYREGGLTRQKVDWILEHIERYPGEQTDEERRSFEAIRQMDDEQLAQMQARGKATAVGGFGVKTYSLPYVDAHLGEIDLLPREVQRVVLEVRDDLSLLNQSVESAREYHKLTFDAALSPENHARVQTNVKSDYRKIEDQAIRIVELIDRLSPPCKKKAMATTDG